MRAADAAHLAGTGLRRNPVRTALTILGLAVGVGAILTVIALGTAGRRQVEEEIARLGVDKLWITAAGDTFLTTGDGAAAAAATGLPACAEAAVSGTIQMGEKQVTGAIGGYDAGIAAVYAPRLAAGRLFTETEQRQAAPVALLDTVMAEALSQEQPGGWVDVGCRRVRVVGIIEPITAQLFGVGSGMLLMPLQTWLDTYAALGVREVTVAVPRGTDSSVLGERAAAVMARGGGSYVSTSMREEIEAVEQVIRIFVTVLACVAAVCMLTGAIGVMNILLVSVRERRREIGLMKAVGATSMQVAALFLLEAAGYALLGGAAGLLLALGMTRACGGWIGLQAALDPGTAAGALAGAALLGVLFGVAPALRAAEMQPVDALRQE